MRRLYIAFLLLFLLPTACTLNVTPSPTSTATVSPTGEPTLVPATPTPASTLPPSSELVVLGRMVSMRRSVACGIIHGGGVAEYTDLIILSGVYYSDTIFAIHGCAELARSEYFKGSGNVESFNVGDYHELHLTKQNVYGIGVWPVGTPEGSTYFCKIVNYYHDAAWRSPWTITVDGRIGEPQSE